MCRNCYGPGSSFQDEYCSKECYIKAMERLFQRTIPDDRSRYEYAKHDYFSTLRHYREFLEKYGSETELNENSFDHLDELYK